MRVVGFAIGSLICLALTGSAQQPNGKGATVGRIVTQTRLVSLYSNLETQLANAAEKNDQIKMIELLTADFTQWTPAPSGDPVPVDDWITKYRPSSFRIRQMAVQNFGKINVASFILTQRGSFGESPTNGSYFVVDLWTEEGGQPKLAVRYISPLQQPSVKVSTPTGKQ